MILPLFPRSDFPLGTNKQMEQIEQTNINVRKEKMATWCCSVVMFSSSETSVDRAGRWLEGEISSLLIVAITIWIAICLKYLQLWHKIIWQYHDMDWEPTCLVLGMCPLKSWTGDGQAGGAEEGLPPGATLGAEVNQRPVNRLQALLHLPLLPGVASSSLEGQWVSGSVLSLYPPSHIARFSQARLDQWVSEVTLFFHFPLYFLKF